MDIQRVDRYVVDGVEFQSHAKAAQHVEDVIADKLYGALKNSLLGPRDKIEAVQAVLDIRADLAPWLAIDVNDHGEG